MPRLGQLVRDLRDVGRAGGSYAGYALTLLNYARYRLDVRRGARAAHDPVFLQLEPTSRCNLRCPMCMRDKVDARYGDMSFDLFRRIIDGNPRLYRLHLQGNGEPFLHRQLLDFVRYARGRGIRVSVISNGTLVTDELAAGIMQSGLNELQFSVDSLDPAVYAAIRVGANLGRVIENVQRTVRARDAAGSPIELSLTVVIQRGNLDRVAEFVSFAAEQRIPKVSFQYLEPKHGEKYEPGFLAAHSPFDDPAQLAARVREVKEQAGRRGIVCDFVSERERGCLWPWDGLYITWDGQVNPCCLIFDHVVGDASREDIRGIWNNDRMREFRRRLGSRDVPDQCRGCCHLKW